MAGIEFYPDLSEISLASHFSVSELIRANHIESPKCSGVEFQSGFMVK